MTIFDSAASEKPETEPIFDSDRDGDRSRLVLLAADTESGLRALRSALAAKLRHNPKEILTATASVVKTGAAPQLFRDAVLGKNGAEVCAALAESDPHVPTAAGTDAGAKAVLMLPGLGDHYVNMGGGLYRTEPIFRDCVDRCAQFLDTQLGVDLRSILYPAGAPTRAAGPAGGGAPKLDLRRLLGRVQVPVDAATARLNQTELAQPALFVVEYALAQLLRHFGLQIACAIGYSLGEYVAACLAGVLSLEDALSLVARRAQMIAKLPAGAMLAVSLSEPEVLSLLGNDLSLSAVNGDDFCVVAGPLEAVAELEQQLRECTVATRRIQTTHAFHSRMMTPIADELTRLVRTYVLHPPKIPYISNVTGAPITAAQATDPSYFAAHLCSPVRCADGFRLLGAKPHRLFVEAGPGRSLCSLATQALALRPNERMTAIALMRADYDSQTDLEVLLHGIGRLWTAGAKLKWDKLPTLLLEVAADKPDTQSAASTNPVSPAAANIPPSESTDPAPDPAILAQLSVIWRELFRVAKVEPHDNFFSLGGNSLIATRMALRLRKAFGFAVPLMNILGAPTLAKLAAVVMALKRGEAPAVSAKPPPSPPVSPQGAAASALLSFELPSGLTIFHQSEAETRHFYSDIFEHRSYLKHGLGIADGACVFDVGANIGMFTLFAAREARGVRIYSFEPAPPLFAILQRNAERHKTAAQLFNYGLSDQEKTSQFTFYPQSSGMSSFHANLEEERQVLNAIIHNQERAHMAGMEHIGAYSNEILNLRFEAQTFPCRLRRLSDVIAEQGVSQIDLLKIDVQKSEREVLDGLAESDWPKIRQIVVEVHDFDGRLAQMVALLESHGYVVHYEQDPLYEGTILYNVYAKKR